MNVRTSIVMNTTEDGFNLYGAWYEPQDAQVALLLLHGYCSNFYRTPLRDVAEYLAPRGYACLVSNTRGHDQLANTEGPQPAEGSFTERISDSPRDINTGLQWLREHGYNRIILVGHSLGALKSIHYMAHHPSPDLIGLISCSCPGWYTSPLPPGSEILLERARQMQAAGQPFTLIINDDGIPQGTPAMLLDRLNNYDAYKPVPNASHITVPVLYLAGDAEPEQFRQVAGEMAQTVKERSTLEIIADADHVYTHREQQLAEIIEKWLNHHCK